ncbi:MAG TPA: dihydrofolate reductase family protein [Actinocatenispora sp.]
MPDSRPYVVLSAAMSVDGYLDDAGDSRLILSSEEDFDRVDAVRAECDAILVGAGTVRRDDPRLMVTPVRAEHRTADGRPAQPLKVTITRGGDLPADSRFFTAGPASKLVYAPGPVAERLADTLAGSTTIVATGDEVDLGAILADLAARGVGRLLVEGGGTVHGWFLTEGLADELHLAVAPLFVGDAEAPRFVGPGAYRWDAAHRMRLAETRALGDVVLLRYLLGDDDG